MTTPIESIALAVAVAVRDQCAAQWCERSSQIADVDLKEIINTVIAPHSIPDVLPPGYHVFDPAVVGPREYILGQIDWCHTALRFAKCNTTLGGAFRDIDKAATELRLLSDAIQQTEMVVRT